MKKTIFLGAAALLIAGCTAPSSKDSFSLKGTIEGADGEYIHLFYMPNDTTEVIDSVLISNGTFAFQGTLEKPFQMAQVYLGDLNDWTSKQRYGFFMEPKPMTLAIDFQNFENSKVEGSFTQAQNDSLNATLNSIKAEAADLYKALEEETDHDKINEIRDQLEPYSDRMMAAQIAFIKTHPNSYLAPYYMRFLMGNMTYGEIKSIYDNFSDEVKQNGDVAEIETELATLARVQPGAPAPEIRKESVTGDTVSISALKGNVVLVDFWASWCGPCRKSFPHVKALYEKYHSKGFEVFCVADNDETPDKWREAIKQDGVEKFYHVLRGLRIEKDGKGRPQLDRSSDVSEAYAIHYLPTKYLIDREGKIIGKFNDEELDAKLKEIFGE